MNQASITPSWYSPDDTSWDTDPHTIQCVIESDGSNGLTRSWIAVPGSASPSTA